MSLKPTSNLKSDDRRDAATRPPLIALPTSLQALMGPESRPITPGGSRTADEHTSILGSEPEERHYGSTAESERGSLAGEHYHPKAYITYRLLILALPAPTSRQAREKPKWKARVKYYIPSIEWIPNYSFTL